MLSSSSIFDSLPTRPPTPPRDITTAVNDAISFLDDSNEVERLTSGQLSDGRPLAGALDLTPSSSQETSTTLSRARKVGFSPYPLYHKISQPGQSSSPSAQLLKHTPSVRNDKPLKSILKLSNLPPPTPDDIEVKLSYFSPEIPGSFSKMLQSVIHQLASPSRTLRLDAYLALNGALKAYEGVPDEQAMVQRMGVIMQFLTRDMVWKAADGSVDTNIVTQALKLTAAILFVSKLAEALDEDFKTFLVDRSITIIEQTDAPKPITKTHLFLLASPRLYSTTITSMKADKILTALQTIEDRCSGNGIIASRLLIYSRLLQQTPAVMLTRARDWLGHVFHGMLSSIQDVRTRAIDTCQQAGLVLGHQPLASKALQEMFDTEVEEGESYFDYLSLRLIQMTADQEIGPSVPQIWSAVVLFFRNKRKPLEKWPKFKSWLLIIQKCLNASDIAVRYQATVAWDKLVFAIMPDSSTGKAMLSMLKVPLCTGMDKRGSDRYSRQVRQYSLDSFFNLVHYALRPGLSNEEHDNAWDVFVDAVLSDMVKSSGKGQLTACRVLQGLVSGKIGVWNANAALESTPVKPEELPRLDPRWVRSRLARILKILEPVVAAGLLVPQEDSTVLDATWYSLMQSIADAGSQEVKTTNDLKEAIALLINFFRRLWNAGPSRIIEADNNGWLNKYRSLVDTMVLCVGASPFAEEILATTQEDRVEVAPTPSHRPSKHHSSPQSPLVILIGQFYQPSKTLDVDDFYQTSVQCLLRRLLTAKHGSMAKLELLSRSLRVWNSDCLLNEHANLKRSLWVVVARTATELLQSEPSASNEPESLPLGNGLRNALDIVTSGLASSIDVTSLGVLEDLLDAMRAAAKTGAGDGGVALAVVEPCAKAIVSAEAYSTLEARLHFATHMLGRVVWPKTRQILDQARKAMWGVGLAPHKAAVFDPFDAVYNMVVKLMSSCYNDLDGIESVPIRSTTTFLLSVVPFLQASPPSLLASGLRKVQAGFVEWIEDKARKTSADEIVSDTIRTMWSSIIRLLQAMPAKDSNLLKALEPLLAAGFSSPHRNIVNETIVFWNESFGENQSLEYPSNLEAVLRARLADTEISLPNFPDSISKELPVSLPAFYDIQSQSSTSPKTRTEAQRQSEQSPLFGALHRSTGGRPTMSSHLQEVGSGSGSSTPKARLRHDDSQVQFALIDSSPLPPANDSQMLTEHQREVKSRQQEEAQLFPDLSSSPMAHSTALPRALAKRLDFTSDTDRQNEDQAPGTPTALPDVGGLPSDDLPSSPTPSSNDAMQGATSAFEDPDVEEAAEEPPSSPPHSTEDKDAVISKVHYMVGPDDTTADVTHVGEIDIEGDLDQQEAREEDDHYDTAAATTEVDSGQQTSDFPSDSILPTEQLQLEQEAAAAAQQPVAATTTNEEAATYASAVPEQSQTSGTSDDSAQQMDIGGGQQTESQDITRVENSFLEPEHLMRSQSQVSIEGERSQRPNRKRKRTRSTVYTAKTSTKKRKPSPFKRILSFLGASQEEEEDDIGEEIVVASSQPTSSPASYRANQQEPSPAKLRGVASEPIGVPVDVVKEEPSTMQPPAKRGRGRPRKSETPTPSQAEDATSRSLKRRASTLSNASTSETTISTSFVKDTPAPHRAKRRQGSQGTSQPSSRVAESSEPTRRVATAVVVESTAAGAIEEHIVPDEAAMEDDGEPNSPDKQLRTEQASVIVERPILTPRRILERLRDALSDFRGMILGSQEEREFDDVLFELRRETHDAARRGREPQR